MPSTHRPYRDDRDGRDRAPPPLPSLPRRADSIAYSSPPSSAHASHTHPPQNPLYGPISIPYVIPRQHDPPTTHKVWVLDCRSCGTFLTNRAMKAVLLLRPNVPLFSTDALPVNCGAYSPSASRSSRSSRTSSSSRTASSNRDRDGTPRTCECLTQTLSCHTCGTSVGYMIVMPCARCTSSTFSPPSGYPRQTAPGYPPPSSAARARATNGHRFVFHSSEVAVEERLYVSGESGVLADADLPEPERPSTVYSPSNAPDNEYYLPPFHARAVTVLSSGPAPGANNFPYTPTAYQAPLSPVSAGGSMSPTSSTFSYAGHPGQYAGSPLPPGSPIPKTSRLRPGEVVYWHHLATRGDLSTVRDDERSRASCGAGSGRRGVDDEDSATLPGMPGAIWCAR